MDSRDELGHWELDSVLGAHGTGGIQTTLERKSRYYLGGKTPQVAAAPALNAQLGVYQALPAHAVRSVTADNGREFGYYYQLADTIAVSTYFCDPHSAYQRGSDEHFNGKLRKYLPRVTSFAGLSQEEVGA